MGVVRKAVDRGLRSSISAGLRGSAPALSSNPPDISQGEMPPPLCKGENGFWGGLGPQQQWKIPSRITHRPAHGHEIRLSIFVFGKSGKAGRLGYMVSKSMNLSVWRPQLVHLMFILNQLNASYHRSISKSPSFSAIKSSLPFEKTSTEPV